MTFNERIINEKDNLTKIILYYDRGLFYNLVERSAYAFNTRIKPFKVHVKTLKSLDKPFVSIGVPVKMIDKYLHGLTYTSDDNGNVTALLAEPIDENAFQAWKKHILERNERGNYQLQNQNVLPPDTFEEKAPEPLHNENENIIHECLMEIKTLNLASMTPMDAMLFLNGIQQKLKDIDI